MSLTQYPQLGLFVRERTLRDQNKNILLRKLQKNSIKTLKTGLNNGVSDSSVVIRRTFVGTSNSGGDLSFSVGANETFNAISNTDYVITVLTAGTGGTAVAGDKIDLTNAHIALYWCWYWRPFRLEMVLIPHLVMAQQ